MSLECVYTFRLAGGASQRSTLYVASGGESTPLSEQLARSPAQKYDYSRYSTIPRF